MGKIRRSLYVLTAAATRGFTMVLFTEPASRRNTFVGDTCAPPSALLVILSFYFFILLERYYIYGYMIALRDSVITG